MLSSSRLITLSSLTAMALLIAAWTSVGGGNTIGHAFLDDWDDDQIGAVPWGMAGPGAPPIQTEAGSIISQWPVDPRAIVEVAPSPGRGGGGDHVLRLSDERITDGTAHSEVTILPFGASGNVIVRFEMSLIDLAGDRVELTIVDNRTTPGTGRLATLEITPSGRLKLGGSPATHQLVEGELYRFFFEFDLGGASDSFSLHVVPRSPGPELHIHDVPITVDALMVTEITFALSDSGQGEINVDEVRVFSGT